VGYGDTANGSAKIGDDSCNYDYACQYAGYASTSSLGVSADIGDDSCNAYQACETYNGQLVVGDGSCSYDYACYYAAYFGSATIGNNSCNDSVTQEYGCYEVGYEGGSIIIGDNSCNDGYEACDYSAYGNNNNNPTVEIGDGSCNGGSYACYAVAYYYGGTATIGSGSCNGEYACYYLAYYDGAVTIGNQSCNGEQACYYAGAGDLVGDDAAAFIGDNSCNGYEACAYAGAIGGGGTSSASVQIGNYSCNAEGACYEAGYDGDGSIGNGSCNQDGQYDQYCNGAYVDVGDCQYNDVDKIPAMCLGTVRVVKHFTDHGSSTVQVSLRCHNAIAVEPSGTQVLGDGDAVEYEVTFTSATVNCTVSEDRGEGDYYQSTRCEEDGVVLGSVRRGSYELELGPGDYYTCTFTNTPVEQDSDGNGGGAGEKPDGCEDDDILNGFAPPPAGGWGTFAFCGGTFAELLAASGCPAATSVFFHNTPDGAFAVWVPGTQVSVVNAAILALFSGSPPIPAATIFTARCV
jgi:hypothetical protein